MSEEKPEIIDVDAEEVKPKYTGLRLMHENKIVFWVRHKYEKLPTKEKINTCLHIMRWAHNEVCVVFSDKKFTPVCHNVKNGKQSVFETRPYYRRLEGSVRVEFLTTLIEWCNFQVQIGNAQLVQDKRIADAKKNLKKGKKNNG